MAKKNWWINLLKNLFTCDSQTKPEKQVKRKGWGCFFNKFKLKQLPSTIEQTSLSEAKEEQRKHALNVAKATAAAAEAAMAAAQAAAEVVRLTGVSRSCVRLPHKEAWNLAATKIQTAFRAYLARKALRALKGVVRIQALARGRAVRRQVNKQKNSRSSHRSRLIYSHNAHRKNCSESREIGEKYQSPRISSELVERSKLESKSQRQWTGSLFSKEELKSLYVKRHEAAFRRERMRQYSFSHRESRSCKMLEETVPLRDHLSHPWISKKWAKEKIALDFRCNTRMSDLGGTLRIKPRNLFEDFSEQVTSSPSSYPRRSFCDVRQKPSFDDDECQLTNSFISYPTYMASTESAKAKMRSLSTPRQRVGYVDACFEQESPCICSSNRPFQWSSSNGDSKTSSAQAILFS